MHFVFFDCFEHGNILFVNTIKHLYFGGYLILPILAVKTTFAKV